LIVQTQATGTSAIVTVKMYQYNASTSTVFPVASSEVTIPAISGIRSVETIPIFGMIQSQSTGGYGQSTVLVLDIRSTAAITLKQYPPDNTTGSSYGPLFSAQGTHFITMKVKG